MPMGMLVVALHPFLPVHGACDELHEVLRAADAATALDTIARTGRRPPRAQSRFVFSIEPGCLTRGVLPSGAGTF